MGAAISPTIDLYIPSYSICIPDYYVATYEQCNCNLEAIQRACNETEIQWQLGALDSNDVLAVSCMNGHLELAQWLLSVNPTLNATLAFKWACRRGHLKVAQWLSTV